MWALVEQIVWQWMTLAETPSDLFQVYISMSKNQKAKTYSHFENFRNRLWLTPI